MEAPGPVCGVSLFRPSLWALCLPSEAVYLSRVCSREFPGRPAVRALSFPAGVGNRDTVFLGENLRCHKPCSVAKKKSLLRAPEKWLLAVPGPRIQASPRTPGSLVSEWDQE